MVVTWATSHTDLTQLTWDRSSQSYNHRDSHQVTDQQQSVSQQLHTVSAASCSTLSLVTVSQVHRYEHCCSLISSCLLIQTSCFNVQNWPVISDTLSLTFHSHLCTHDGLMFAAINDYIRLLYLYVLHSTQDYSVILTQNTALNISSRKMDLLTSLLTCILLLTSSVSSSSLNHNGITVNFDTKECEFGKNNFHSINEHKFNL